MKASIGVVRGWEMVEVEGDAGTMKAASLVKLVIGHLALHIVGDLDEPIDGEITTRNVLSHTPACPTGAPKARL
jgi:hypothetical protein